MHGHQVHQSVAIQVRGRHKTRRTADWQGHSAGETEHAEQRSPLHQFNRGPTNAAIVDLARTDLERFAPVLDDHLESHRYLVGDRITIADYSMIVLEGYRAAASFDWSPYPHINGYFDRMRAVDPWVRTAVTDPSTIGRKPKAA